MALVTLTEINDESLLVVLPVTPKELSESGSAITKSFEIMGSGAHSVPAGRSEEQYPLSGTLPGGARSTLPYTRDRWREPQSIIDQVRDWLGRGAKLRYAAESKVGYAERSVFITSYRFVRTGSFGDVTFDVSLIEWRQPRMRIDDGTDSGGDTNTDESAHEGTEEEPTPATYTVQLGDTLSLIARTTLGDASKWREIWDANKDAIPDANLIHPGDVLNIPGGTQQQDEAVTE